MVLFQTVLADAYAASLGHSVQIEMQEAIEPSRPAHALMITLLMHYPLTTNHNKKKIRNKEETFLAW